MTQRDSPKKADEVPFALGLNYGKFRTFNQLVIEFERVSNAPKDMPS